MNLERYTLFFTILIMSQYCFGMDVDPRGLQNSQNPSAQTSPLLNLPDEVSWHILTCVVAQDPDAIGNLAKIQEVCKRLAGFLSKNTMKCILELNERELVSQLYNALRVLDHKKLRFLINLGALADDECKDGVILRAVIHAANSTDIDYYQKLLQVIQILEKAGGTWKGNAYDKQKNSLEYVTILPRLPLVRLLLEHGIQPTSQAAIRAIDNNHPEITALLMKYGATPTPAMMFSIVVMNRNPDLLRILINYGADVNQVCGQTNRPPLEFVSNLTNPEIPKILLQAGAIPQGGELPKAVLHDNVPFAQLLIDYGADINAIAGHEYPMPPLAYVKTPQMATVLLKAGAELFIDYGQRPTPFRMLVNRAIDTKNPMILVEILKTRYPYPTALAIAAVLINGAPYISAMCTIV